MEPLSPSDTEQLTDWLRHQREAAFHALVARYASLVHMAALRTCRDEALAAEASQLTFILLVRKAKSLTTRSSLAGWLHLTAVMQAKNLLRQSQRETRKRQHLQAAMETDPPDSHGSPWQDMQPFLDDALASLSEKDRETLLLRFYRSLSIREVASTLGIATDAAQKRLDRATERLRAKLTRRGCQVPGSLAAAMLAGFAADSTDAASRPVSPLVSKALLVGPTSSAGLASLTHFITITALKTHANILPLFVLILSGCWLGMKYRSISVLENESLILQKQTAMVQASGPKNSTMSSKSAAQASIGNTSAALINWKKLSAYYAVKSPGKRRTEDLDTIAEVMGFRQKLPLISKDDLADAVDQITAFGQTVDPEAKLQLMFHLGDTVLYHIVLKDPEFALSRFASRITNEEGFSAFNNQLCDALKSLAGRDSGKAAGWVDRQIEDGRFESKLLNGKSSSRSRFEAVLVQVLLPVNPAGASSRLRSVPEDQREAVLKKVWPNLAKNDHLAFATLARDHLPLPRQMDILTQNVSRMSTGQGFLEIVEYMDRISASPAERTACVAKASYQKITEQMGHQAVSPADLDDLRKWITRQAPDAVADISGKSLARIADGKNQMNFGEAAALASQYDRASGNEEVLCVFLESGSALKNKALASSLAQTISDETRRKHILKKLQEPSHQP